MVNMEDLFSYACAGNIKRLKEYYQSKEGVTGRTFQKFGKEHSLVMGAFRNDQFETVKFLLEMGEAPTAEEKEQVKRELMRWEVMKLMVKEEAKLVDGITTCCGYDFGVDFPEAKYCPICGKKLVKDE